MRAGDVIRFTEDMGDLLASGLQVEQALQAMENRSASKLGTLAKKVRDLVRDRHAHLFYYASGQQVEFATAIDAARSGFDTTVLVDLTAAVDPGSYFRPRAGLGRRKQNSRSSRRSRCPGPRAGAG